MQQTKEKNVTIGDLARMIAKYSLKQDENFEKVDKKFEKVNAEINSLRSDINDRFDTLETKLDRRIGILEQAQVV